MEKLDRVKFFNDMPYELLAITYTEEDADHLLDFFNNMGYTTIVEEQEDGTHAIYWESILGYY